MSVIRFLLNFWLFILELLTVLLILTVVITFLFVWLFISIMAFIFQEILNYLIYEILYFEIILKIFELIIINTCCIYDPHSVFHDGYLIQIYGLQFRLFLLYFILICLPSKIMSPLSMNLKASSTFVNKIWKTPLSNSFTSVISKS